MNYKIKDKDVQSFLAKIDFLDKLLEERMTELNEMNINGSTLHIHSFMLYRKFLLEAKGKIVDSLKETP